MSSPLTEAQTREAMRVLAGHLSRLLTDAQNTARKAHVLAKLSPDNAAIVVLVNDVVFRQLETHVSQANAWLRGMIATAGVAAENVSAAGAIDQLFPDVQEEAHHARR
jgi:hypothetical protein